jgi:hypothetical protein
MKASRFYRKGHGKEAKSSYVGHVLRESRYGLIADEMLATADGTAARDSALLMKRRKQRRNGSISVGAGDDYDTQNFLETPRSMGVRPHVTQNVNLASGSAIDGRTLKGIRAIKSVKRSGRSLRRRLAE